MKVNVVYYSRSGKNEQVAKAIARALENRGHTAELDRLETTNPNAKIISTIFMSVFRSPAKLINPPDVSDGDLLVLVGPVWASAMCPAMRAFLTTLPDLGGRKVLNIVGGFNPHETVVRDINHKIKPHHSGQIISDALRMRDVDTPEKTIIIAREIAGRVVDGSGS